jgi:hypothetical protein
LIYVAKPGLAFIFQENEKVERNPLDPKDTRGYISIVLSERRPAKEMGPDVLLTHPTLWPAW